MTGVGGPDIARPPENEKCRTGLISRAAFFARGMSELFTFRRPPFLSARFAGSEIIWPAWRE
ncbi:hypothetical protein AGR4B_Cc50088 [Agrobacterium tumefaciens str. CFBP 5621]|nr:hypothetical protein AGR4B_Cc50088 [Agrobacterium tumefaciens str. CFBP 5621]